MRRKTILLLCTAGAIGWSSQVVADDVEPKKAKAAAAKPQAAEMKAVRVKAFPKKEAVTPLGELWNGAVRAVGGIEGVKALAPEIARDVAMVREFEQQYGAPFRQLYRTELHFMRLVCQPTKEQYEKISADHGKTLRATVTRFAVMMRESQRGGRMGGAQHADPRQLITDGLVKSVQATLSSEQAARYQKELDLRAAARKRVVLLNLVARLDKSLVLTAEQRDKLSEILDQNWNASWNHTHLLMNGDHYFPQLPDNKVLPLLNRTQKTVWHGIPKVGHVFFGLDMGMVQGIDLGEEVWDGERPVESQKRADDKAAGKGKEAAKTEEKKVSGKALSEARSRNSVAGFSQPESVRSVTLRLLPLALLAAFAPNARAQAQQKEDQKAEFVVDLNVAVELVVAQAGYTDAQFDQWVFQHHGNASGARRRLDTLLALQAEDIDRVCQLTDAQKKKLQLAGRGDIKRFFDRYEKVKQKFQLLKHDEQKFQEIWNDINPLQMTLQAGLFHEDSFLYKSLHNTLTGEQFARYDGVARDRRAFRHRANIELAVALFEQSMPLRDEQRREFITLLANKTKPSRRSNQYGYYVLMFQLARLPEEELKPLFDNTQWKVVNRLLAQVKGMEPWLRQSGQLADEEDEADTRPAAR